MELNCNLKFNSEWIGYDKVWFMCGQVNDRGKAHGIARMIYKDGKFIREGQFVNGLLSGYGRMINGGLYYVGDWKYGQYHGFGT